MAMRAKRSASESRAPLRVEESVAGVLRVVAGLGAADNGRFLDHLGDEVPW